MPTPVSFTPIYICEGFEGKFFANNVIDPFGVNFIAFERKFIKIYLNLLGSENKFYSKDLDIFFFSFNSRYSA